MFCFYVYVLQIIYSDINNLLINYTRKGEIIIVVYVEFSFGLLLYFRERYLYVHEKGQLINIPNEICIEHFELDI